MNTLVLNYKASPNFKDWETPPEFYAKLNSEFGFTYDPAASHENHLCDFYSTREGSFYKNHRHQLCDEDGLTHSWAGQRVYCNPPYDSSIVQWVAKAAKREAEVAVLLLPPSIDTAWFHDYIWGRCEVRFLRGRLKFWRDGKPGNAPRAGNMLAVFR